MSESHPSMTPVEGELRTVQEQLMAMADLVESALAEGVVALVDNEPGAAEEARLEDYKTHRAWLELDGLCLDLLSSGELTPEQVRVVHAATKIAMNLRLMADQCVSISQHRQLSAAEKRAPGPVADTIPDMVQIAQSMLSDSVDALVNSDVVEAESLRRTYPQMASLGRELFRHLSDKAGSAGGLTQADMATALIARSLEAIGRHALDVANDVARLCADRERVEEPEATQ